MELELARNGSNSSLNGGNATRQRRHYASLDPTSMGVDVHVGPVMNLNSLDYDNNRFVSRLSPRRPFDMLTCVILYVQRSAGQL